MKSANDGGIRDPLRDTIASFGRTWLRWRPQQCGWCGAALTEADVDAYGEWCIEVAKHVPERTNESRVPCLSCAGPAMSEIVDGIRFAPNARPSTERPDPWSRPKWTPDENRERYP